MSERMSRASYVERCRTAIIQTAADMLDGRLGFLNGSRKLNSLLNEIGLNLPDPHVQIFMVIDSETDAFPLGEIRQYWHDEALRRLEPDIQDTERWAREVGRSACVELIRRFAEGPPPPGEEVA